ncbi:hypothetical protein [Thiomonas sp. X19]|uniref:hypothetical protein n=1 Tax=Thiomonas sp. X19 TaxID=1050370 RepID=UPI0011BED93C|nr:hypothetical protein [Thiomonas sp. X19]
MAPIAAFSEAMADWREVDPMSGAIMHQAQRLVIVDEHIPMAREVEIDAGDVKVWRNRLDGLLERLEKTIQLLGKKKDPNQAETEELGRARAMRKLVPEVDKLFRDVGAQIAGDQPIDTQRVIDMQKRVTKAGGSTAGTARWEKVSYSHADDDFFIPLRALSTLARNCQAGTTRQEKGAAFIYETSPIIEWARDKGSIIFLDATMSLAIRQFIQARGGRIHEATASQNMHVTRMTGHLYARGDVKKAAYPDEARAHLAEIRDLIAPQLPQPAAIIAHKAYLRYSQVAHQADDATQVAAQQFEAETGVPIGWFGRHDRGLDLWGGRHLALVGMPLLSKESLAGLYAATRAALADCGIQRPAWDRVMDKDKPDADGPPLPRMPEVRAWLLDEYAQTLAQGIGRNRAVNHPRDAAPLQVQLWGGIQTIEMDAAMTKYGVVIHDRKRNPRSIAGPKVDQGAVNAAIEMVQAAGLSVSERSVRAALVGLRRCASTDSIRARIRELRASGTLSPATRVRASKIDPAVAIDAMPETATAYGSGEGQENDSLTSGGHATAPVAEPVSMDSSAPGFTPETTAPNSHKDSYRGNSAQCITVTETQKQGQEKIFFAPAVAVEVAVDDHSDDWATAAIEDMLQQVAAEIEASLAQRCDDDDDPDDPGPRGGGQRPGATPSEHDHHGAHFADAPDGAHRRWRLGATAPPS